MRMILLFACLVLSQAAQARSEPLNTIIADIADAMMEPTKPVVVTDLDETLVDSTARRFFSYRQAIREICGDVREGDCGKIAGMNLGEFFSLPNRYDQSPLFESLGIRPSAWLEKVKQRMFDIYLSGSYLELDQPIPGAAEFIQTLKLYRPKIFYVSSRLKASQLAGTIASLKDMGLLSPGEESQVILRSSEMTSIQFKRESFRQIEAWAEKHFSYVHLAMENEPENMTAMREIFPRAQGVFVDGATEHGGTVDPAVLRIKHFR